MNELDLLLTENEDFKFITVVFAPYTGNNSYTYKTTLAIEVEDFVIVKTPSNGFQVVQVREVLDPMEADLASNIKYKWVVQKVDTTSYDRAVQAEKELRTVVNKSKKKAAVVQAKEALGEHLNEAEVQKLVRL